MPRKPNYKFERMSRERNKAAKKAARLEAKKEKAEQRKLEKAGPDSPEVLAESDALAEPEAGALPEAPTPPED